MTLEITASPNARKERVSPDETRINRKEQAKSYKMMSHSLLCVLYAQRTTLTKCRSERVTLVGRYEWGNASSPSLLNGGVIPPNPHQTERAGLDEQDAGPLVFLRAFYAENDDILSSLSSDFAAPVTRQPPKLRGRARATSTFDGQKRSLKQARSRAIHSSLERA